MYFFIYTMEVKGNQNYSVTNNLQIFFFGSQRNVCHPQQHEVEKMMTEL